MADHLPMGTPDQLVTYFHQKYHKPLLAYSISVAKRFARLPLRGEDFVNDFYLRVMEKPELIRNGYKKYRLPYLLRIIRNQALNHDRRDQARRQREELFCDERDTMTIPGEAAKPLRGQELVRLMEHRLNEKDMLIFRHYWEGYTAKEIGLLFNMNHHTVGVRIYRIRKDLRWYFTVLGYGRKYQRTSKNRM